MTDLELADKALSLCKSRGKLIVFLLALSLMQGALCAHLMYQLSLSRNNERQMSQRYYELGKAGIYKPHTNENTK